MMAAPADDLNGLAVAANRIEQPSSGGARVFPQSRKRAPVFKGTHSSDELCRVDVRVVVVVVVTFQSAFAHNLMNSIGGERRQRARGPARAPTTDAKMLLLCCASVPAAVAPPLRNVSNFA
jgi:hypothetical protein